MFLYEKPVVETNFVGTRLILNYEKIDMNHSGSNHMINDIKGSFCIKNIVSALRYLYAAISCALVLYFDWLGGAQLLAPSSLPFALSLSETGNQSALASWPQSLSPK